MNRVILIGRLTKDVDYRQNGETTIARFTIAVDRRKKNDNGQNEADFPTLVAFNKQADFISKYFSKGMKIGIVGRLQTGSYTDKDGNRKYSVDVIVDEAEFVESKNSQNTQKDEEPNSAPVQTAQTDNDGFMNIEDDMPESLPFN